MNHEGWLLLPTGRRRISAANFVEAAVIIDSRDPIASRRFDELVHEAQIVIEPHPKLNGFHCTAPSVNHPFWRNEPEMI
jgi:hypothetical protein